MVHSDAPISPDRIPLATTLTTLLQEHYDHDIAMLLHHTGEEPLSAGELAELCLRALAVQATLAERVQWGRWVVATDALDAGATRQQVATAMGITVTGLREGLTAWAKGQARCGHITPEERDRVLTMAAEDLPGVDRGDR